MVKDIRLKQSKNQYLNNLSYKESPKCASLHQPFKWHPFELFIYYSQGDMEEFDEDDLDIIEGGQRGLTRLKKKVKEYESEEQYDNYHGVEIEDDDEELSEDEDGGMDYSRQGEAESEEEHSRMVEFHERDMEVFDPTDLKQLKTSQDESEILSTDLPERYINLLRMNVRNPKTKLDQIREQFEKEDRTPEAGWIYNRMRSMGFLQNYSEPGCKEQIRKVLDCIHKDHLETMYIFNYRKKLFNDYLNLQNLWQIEALDREWNQFSQGQRKLKEFVENFSSIVPSQLREMIGNLHDPKDLNIFKDYKKFMLTAFVANNEMMEGEYHSSVSEKEMRSYQKDFITQMAKRGVIEELENTRICISPQMLCHNITKRAQEHKPRSPQLQPKDQFERILGSSNPETDKQRFPLLVGENRFKTIAKYLSYQLFTYPEFRKILKEKYFKRLVISTSPTPSGAQAIDLYHQLFPTKRIKDKPISTLKRQMWILILQAERQGHIKVDLKFQWEITSTQRNVGERDQVYLQIIRNYYDLNTSRTSQMWNIFRKRVIATLLNDFFIPAFTTEVREQLTQDGQRQIIAASCSKLRQQLSKGPSLKESKSIKILALVLQQTKLGVAFVDQSGRVLHSYMTLIANDTMLKDFVGGQNLKFNIKEYKPDMILISANCKKAQNLRKQLRNPDLFTETIFCSFGQYQIPRLVAKKRIILGFTEQEAILEAISMARLKQNPMAEIISLWSQIQKDNGILSMNLHPNQKFIYQKRLKNALERVIIQVVNLQGLNINNIKDNEHLQNQLRFISGLGDKRSRFLLQKLKSNPLQMISRKQIQTILKGDIVSKNTLPFLKVESSYHRNLFDKLQKQKKGHVIHQYDLINLLDMTRIPEEWHRLIFRKLTDGFKTTIMTQIRSRKAYSRLSDENIYLLQIFRNSDRARSIDWRMKDSPLFDEEFVKTELMHRFKTARHPERVMENRQIFYNLLRETPDTLKRYMMMTVKVLSIKKNYLNVIITENGLFGYIRLQSSKTTDQYQKIYEKGTFIKAIIIGFPFDEKRYESQQPTQEQELLKVQMSLEFPHKDAADRHQNMKHQCLITCFPSIVKAIHPLIDLEKDRFELKKEDKPHLDNREDRQKDKYVMKNLKPDFRRISHPKFRNISAQPAIELMKSQHNGDFIIRPSSSGSEYLVITWKFYGKVIVHIKVRCEHRVMGGMNMTYRIQDRENRSYNSLDELVDRTVKQMNQYVQDVTSNRKFLDRTIDEIENTVKRDMSQDGSHIYYYFGVSEEYPQFFLLIYMYKDKKPIRELIKVKGSGLYFHDQQFSNTRDLIAWFKEHLKEKEYQRYVKNTTQQLKTR